MSVTCRLHPLAIGFELTTITICGLTIRSKRKPEPPNDTEEVWNPFYHAET